MHGFQSSAVRKLAGPQRLADGGLIRSLFGGGPKETVSEKFARQDAELKAKMAAKAPAPAPAPAADSSVAGSYGAVNVLQRREKAAGLANGGPVKAGIIKGPGSGTSDSIPGTMPAGSFVMPADSTEVLVSNGETNFPPEAVAAVGVAALTAMRDATHAPTPDQEPAGQFADGGRVGDTIKRGRRAAPYVNHRPYTPPPPPVSTALTVPPPAPYQPNFTMGATPPAVDPATDVRPKYNPANGSPEAKAWQAERVATAPPVGAPVASAAQPAPGYGARAMNAVRNAGSAVLNNPVARAVSRGAAPLMLAGSGVATSQTPTEDYEQRFGFQPSTNDSPGTRFVRDVGVRALGAASDLGNAMTLGFAGNVFRDKVGQQQALAAPAPAPSAVRTAAPAVGTTQTDVQRGGAADVLSTPLPGIQKTVRSDGRVLYSDGAGDAALMARGPISAQNMGAAGALADRSQAESLSRVRAGMNREQEQREVAEAQRINSFVQERYNTPTRGQMRVRELAARERESGARLTNETRRVDTEAARFGMDARNSAVDAQLKSTQLQGAQQLQSAQAAVANAKTPEERASAVEVLRTLQGKYEREIPNRFTVVPGGTDDMGNKLASSVLNNQTGEFVQPTQRKAAGYPEGTRSVINGKTAVWKGGKWVPQ